VPLQTVNPSPNYLWVKLVMELTLKQANMSIQVIQVDLVFRLTRVVLKLT